MGKLSAENPHPNYHLQVSDSSPGWRGSPRNRVIQTGAKLGKMWLSPTGSGSPVSLSAPEALRLCGKQAPEILFLAMTLSGQWLTVSEIEPLVPFAISALKRALALGLKTHLLVRRQNPQFRREYQWTFFGDFSTQKKPSNSFSKRYKTTSSSNCLISNRRLVGGITSSKEICDPPEFSSNLLPPEMSMKRIAKAKPPLPEPDPLLRDRIFQLESLWTNTCRNAFQSRFWRSLFKTQEPWRDPDPKQQRRWKAFTKLVTQLDTYQIDPKEYIAAIVQFYRDRHASGNTYLHNPNISQVTGPWGLKIWQEWRAKRLAEGYGDTTRLRGAAESQTQHPDDSLKVEIKQAYDECCYHGPDLAPTLLWGPEILWLFYCTEAPTRPMITDILLDLKETDPERYQNLQKSFRDLKADTLRQQWLLRLKREALGNNPPVPTVEQWESGHVLVAQRTVGRRPA